MAEPPVVDASPLIYLSRADLLDLLRLAGDSDPTARALVTTDWRRGVIPNARATLQKLRGAGMYLSDTVLDDALSMTGE